MTTLWSREEHGLLVRLVRDGKSNREISKIIGTRSKSAIAARAKEYRLRTVTPVPMSVPSTYLTEFIREADVPAWYVLGWRFAGFSGTRCKMVWVGSRLPRKPNTVETLAAA